MSVTGGINRKALDAFNVHRLNALYETMGTPVTYLARYDSPAPIKLLGCHSAVRNNQQLRDGGYELLHDFTCRIRKDEYPTAPSCEGRLIVGLTTYRIAEVVDSALSGEWKLGLRTGT
jgi:hypothetical protein